MARLFSAKLCVYATLGIVVLVSSGLLVSGQEILGDFMNKASETDAGNSDGMRMVRKMVAGLMNVGQGLTSRMSSSPGSSPVYDMVKNDTALGINVLSGLVKVDRMREPGRPRALSVRVFGIPVYNRGFSQGDRMPSDKGQGSSSEPETDAGQAARPGGGPAGGSEDEELPLDP